MKYYKIIHGYKKDDFISIDETELEKALYVHLMKKDGLFKNGSISGQFIHMIKPDYNKSMGWNEGHQADEYDFIDVRKVLGTTLEKQIATAKERVTYFIKNGQENLVGSGVEVKALENPIRNEVKQLAKRMEV